MTTLPLTDTLIRPPVLALVAPPPAEPREQGEDEDEERRVTYAPLPAIRLSDRERLELLLEAGRILDDPADLVGALRTLARRIAGKLGEACLIDVCSDGTPVPLAVAHVDLGVAVEVQELRRRHPPRQEDRAGVAEVLRTGRAELHAELPRGTSLRVFREIGATAALVAPIRAPVRDAGSASRVPVLGAVTVLAGAERRFEGTDLEVLEDLGARVGHAAAAAGVRDARPSRPLRDRDRLLALEKQARAAAEVAVHRISTLQGVTAALSEAVTLAQVADIIVRESLVSLGARAGTVHLLDAAGASLQLVTQRGLLPAGAAAMARLPLDGAVPVVVNAFNAGKPMWIVGRDRVRAACPELGRRLVGDREPAALAAIPLAVGGRVAGVLGMVFDEPNDLPEEDRVFALALVRHCAQAIDRARLYEAERRSNQRLALLARAGELLAASIDYETTLEAAARVALPALGDYCFLDVLGEGGARRLSRAHGADDDTELTGLAERGATPPVGGARLETTVDEAVLERLARRLEDLPLLRRLRLGSLVVVPLVAHDVALGTLTLAFGPSGRRHGEADLEMAGELAHRAAIAVENALLHRASREAVERAQEANRRSELASRTKDEFLGVVSHELRTPLNAVLGWSQLLRGPCAGDPSILTKGLKVIDRNARAQAKLIEDILDVSRIITGKLRLELRPLDLDGVVRAALEVVRPAAEAKSIDLATTIAPGATVCGDPDRLQQVAWNLLSNAVKFTPEGGRVEITLAREPAAAVIVVRDSGRGIEPEVLPHVFERFWQADSSPTRRHGGLGLGLAIVRHLVELHGGTVRADSEGPGQGAAFTVRLPAREEAPSAEGEEAPHLRDSDPSDPAAHRARLDGLSVLVVDDEADARELVATMLSTAGAAVTTATSADEAMAALERDVPDVLISDVGMPGEDGHALLRRVRASHRLCRLPAVALTAYAGAEDARRAVMAGFHTHMAKPAEPALLTAVVASLAGRVSSV